MNNLTMLKLSFKINNYFLQINKKFSTTKISTATNANVKQKNKIMRLIYSKVHPDLFHNFNHAKVSYFIHMHAIVHAIILSCFIYY